MSFWTCLLCQMSYTYHRALPNNGRFCQILCRNYWTCFQNWISVKFYIKQTFDNSKKKISNKKKYETKVQKEDSFSFWLMIRTFGTKITWLLWKTFEGDIWHQFAFLFMVTNLYFNLFLKWRHQIHSDFCRYI